MKNIISVLMVGMLLISMISPVYAQEKTLFEKILDFFKLEEPFSIVGQDRQCEIYPYYKQGQEKYDKDGMELGYWSYSSGEQINLDAGSYCSSGYGLFNTYGDTWNNPLKEYKDDINFQCAFGECIVELYCCPYDECSSDSQCEERFEEGYTCVTENYPEDELINYEYSTYQKCQSPTDLDEITCWQYNALEEECQSRTYDENYEPIYPNCPATYPFKSKADCEGTGDELGGGCGNTDIGYSCKLDQVLWGLLDEGWAYVDDCKTGFCQNTLGPRGGVCAEPVCCQTNFGNKLTSEYCPGGTTEVELSKCDGDQDGKQFDASKLCSGEGVYPGNSQPVGTLDNAKKFALSKEKIKTATTGDMLAAVCNDDTDCIVKNDEEDYEADCIPISKLREEGIVSESKQENFFSDAKSVLTGGAVGGALGIATCIGLVGAGIVSNGILVPAAIGGCAAAGALLGGSTTSAVISATSDDELVKQLDAENADQVGICTLEPKSPGMAFIRKIGEAIPLTGDPTTDGIIVLVGGLFLFMIIYSQMLSGEIKYKKWIRKV